MIHKVRLLAEAQAPAERNRRVIEGIGRRGHPVLGQSAKDKIEEAFHRFVGMTSALVPGRQRDADLHLPGIILPAMEATVTDDAAGPCFHDRHLKPGAGDVGLRGRLLFNQSGGVVRSK